ncbi:6-carboxytetrahydropterin synthase QueD [Spongiactinospora gelatinilytica]|uniref:6-carboxy-5,6,7,8-tetrahydropterin synthase n=1 Tax=Spongiactinospora gelatinilytica TaxID=2666298 RepID=A0A2W2G898_9ACTN|nr:6-pyruvoyl tetrahydropterin synthase family protein [Spongiactinospora gelatinilytica]PZG44541.1 6-carboxytetrahydropterin synthase QueD [Spongiactinospora gelatinilytica]
MYVIAKRFAFSASHRLDLLPEGHPCRRDHGHNYVVEIRLTAQELDPYGFVADFSELTPVRDHLADTYDHRCLNDVLEQPTCERLARRLYRWCSDNLPVAHLLRAVRVSETPSTWAEYREEP